MIIPDANLLVYAYDSRSPFHKKSSSWWSGTLSGSEPVGVPWIVLLAFTRLMTHPQICMNPLSSEDIRNLTDQWWDCPQLRLIQPSEKGVSVFFDLLRDAGMGGNLSTDALIAVCAREHSATIYSNDHDFNRFPGIRWVNPLV